MQSPDELSRHYRSRLQLRLTEELGDKAPRVTNFATGVRSVGADWEVTLEAELTSGDTDPRWVTGAAAADDFEAAYDNLVAACLAVWL